jgi:DNA invertase Pin-like site-specific DNA recombinase
VTSSVTCDLYLRLSDARVEEALDGREARLRARADELEWTVHRVIVENDLTRAADGSLRPVSAFKRRKITTPSGTVELRTVRPGFRSMLDDLMSGRVNAILVEDLDRTMRQPRDGEDLLDAMEMTRATARSLSGSLTLTNGGTDGERFTARVLTAAANKSSADTARRVSDSRERLAGRSYQGGRRPYGHRHVTGTEKYHRTLVIDEDEAKVIRDAAADVLDRDISLKAIARELRAHDVPTVTECAWTAATLKDVLVKPSLAGLAVCRSTVDGETVTELKPAPWAPILERDVWERLCDKMTDPGPADEQGQGE